MKIVIAQYYTKNLTHGVYAEAINRKYAEENGYVYYVDTDNDKIVQKLNGRAPTWYKSHLILDVFKEHNPDYVLFLDTDAIISDTNGRIEQFIDENYDFIAAKDNSEHSLMNAGVFLIKNTDWAVNFLNAWWDLGATVKPTQSRSIPISDHDMDTEGYFLNRLWMDQTLLTVMYENYEEFRSRMGIISNRSFNWMRYNDNNFIFHAYAYGAIKNRTIDLIHNEIFEITPDIDKTRLADWATLYHTDKHYAHGFFNGVYQDLFLPIKETTKKFVELGVYEGESINIWKNFFENSEIIGLDCSFNSSNIRDLERISLVKINSAIREDLEGFASQHNDIDVFMDDGSHIMRDQQITLGVLFKSIKSGGIFILEDLHTSVSVKNNNESIWGQKNETTTLDMLERFNETGKIESDFLTDDEARYLEENIKECKIYKLKADWSYTSVIIKK